MKKCFRLCLVIAASAVLQTRAEPIRILCLGDSITQGGRRDRDEHTYRLPLQRMLHEAGVPFDFIGSRKQGLHPDAVWPEVAPGVPFDLDHEGYYGNTTEDAVRKMIAAWPPDGPAPEIALIHLGTNDQGNPEEVRAPLEKAISFLRGKNPRIVILLGHLCFNDSPGAFRVMAETSALAKAANTEESPVTTVPHYQGWQENPAAEGTDTFDWSHPNPQGQQKMAEKWFHAMTPHLKLTSP